jgi:hypothetical protein
LASTHQHARAGFRIDDRATGALEHVQRFFLGNADQHRQPGKRLEDIRPIWLEPIGFAIRVERARRVVELALVDQPDLAEQLGALLVVGCVDRAPPEQIGEHRPLLDRAIEQLERLVRLDVTGLDQQHTFVAIGGVVAAADVLPRGGDLGEPAHRTVLVDIDQAVHRVERELAPALGQPREAEQWIEVDGTRVLCERGQPHDERAVGVLARLEVLAELAQDLCALVRFFGRLGTLEVHVDDLVALGVECARCDPGGRAFDRGA